MKLRGERNQNKDEGRRDEEKREIGHPGAGIALQSLLLGPSRELDKHSMHLARFSLKARLPLLPCHLFGSRAIVLRAPIASYFDSCFNRQLIETSANRADVKST